MRECDRERSCNLLNYLVSGVTDHHFCLIPLLTQSNPSPVWEGTLEGEDHCWTPWRLAAI